MFSLNVVYSDKFNKKTNVDNYKKAQNQTIKLITYEAEDGCINECPVRTGFLRDSHYTQFSENVGKVMNSADYAHDVIYGTPHSRSNNYPQRVLNSMKLDYEDIYSQALKEMGVDLV